VHESFNGKVNHANINPIFGCSRYDARIHLAGVALHILYLLQLNRFPLSFNSNLFPFVGNAADCFNFLSQLSNPCRGNLAALFAERFVLKEHSVDDKIRISPDREVKWV